MKSRFAISLNSYAYQSTNETAMLSAKLIVTFNF